MARKSTKTLADIQKQIATLEAQAQTLRVKETSGVIAKIKVAIEHYGITADQLGFGKAAKATKPAKVPKAAKVASRNPVPVKYRDDQSNTWTGRGNKPRWLAAALSQGKRVEDFLIKT